MPTTTHDIQGAANGTTECPHCHKSFTPSVDAQQPPRLQGAKCPHCKLFVPLHAIDEAGTTGPRSSGGRFRR